MYTRLPLIAVAASIAASILPLSAAYSQTAAGRDKNSVLVPATGGTRETNTPGTATRRASILPERSLKEQYRVLLRQPNTGIAKLLDADCGNAASVLLVSADPGCDNRVEGGGPQYSFRERDHSVLGAADIQLKKGRIVAGSVLTLGALVDLGDVDVEKLTADSKGVDLLATYKAESELSFVKKEAKALGEGRRKDGYIYSANTPVNLGHVYALRSIAYRSGEAADKRDDVLVVFRIVGVDVDGNVTLVWRELRRQNAPTIDLNK